MNPVGFNCNGRDLLLFEAILFSVVFSSSLFFSIKFFYILVEFPSKKSIAFSIHELPLIAFPVRNLLTFSQNPLSQKNDLHLRGMSF